MASHLLIVEEPHTLPRRRTESIGGRGRQLLFAGSLLLAAQVHVGTFTAFAYTAGLIVFICKSIISLSSLTEKMHDNSTCEKQKVHSSFTLTVPLTLLETAYLNVSKDQG